MRPSAEGWTTTTLACSQASRHATGRTAATSASEERRSASWAAWSSTGTFGVPQQQPRQTETVQRAGALGACSAAFTRERRLIGRLLRSVGTRIGSLGAVRKGVRDD